MIKTKEGDHLGSRSLDFFQAAFAVVASPLLISYKVVGHAQYRLSRGDYARRTDRLGDCDAALSESEGASEVADAAQEDT